jgi:hypothetical protein
LALVGVLPPWSPPRSVLDMKMQSLHLHGWHRIMRHAPPWHNINVAGVLGLAPDAADARKAVIL